MKGALRLAGGLLPRMLLKDMGKDKRRSTPAPVAMPSGPSPRDQAMAVQNAPAASLGAGARALLS